MFKFANRISVFALMAVGLSAQTATTPPAQETLTSGIVGIAEGQTARLNALNAGVVPPAATGASCSGLLAFVADDGTILKTKTVSVAAGASGEIVLDSVLDLALAVNARRDIRATITIPPVPPPTAASTTSVTPVCKLIGTLEIYNTLNGHTQVTLGTVHLVPSSVVTPGS
jgi:hypothetical protein